MSQIINFHYAHYARTHHVLIEITKERLNVLNANVAFNLRVQNKKTILQKPRGIYVWAAKELKREVDACEKHYKGSKGKWRKAD